MSRPDQPVEPIRFLSPEALPPPDVPTSPSPEKPFVRGSSPARIEKLNRLGRRCSANNSTCVHTASVCFTVTPVFPDSGERRGPDEERMVCSRHRKLIESNPTYKVIKTVQLAPLPDHQRQRRQ